MIKLQSNLKHAIQEKLGEDWDVYVGKSAVIARTNIDPIHMLVVTLSTRRNEIIGGIAHEEKEGASRSPLDEGDGWKVVIDAEYSTQMGTENNLPETGKRAAATIRSEFHRIGWDNWKNALHLS